MRWRARAGILLLLLFVAGTAGAQTLDDASRLVEQKRFADAEEVYRGILAQIPGSREAAIGLGRVLLWQSELTEAAEVFRRFLERKRDDAEALEGLATALYWSGDYRGAQREFERLRDLQPSNETARRSLEEIRSVSRPLWRASGEVVDDDQPFTLARADAGGSFFSDPLTRWDVHAGSWFYDDPLRERSGDAPYIRLGGEIVVPRLRLTIAPSVTALRFPDEESKLLPGLALSTRAMADALTLRLGAVQRELLWTATAVTTHPTVTDVVIAAAFDRRGWLASASAHHLEYFDHNEGTSADAWILVPLRVGEGMTFHAGVSGAYRDTEESRFTFENVYDPYYTPMNQTEGRLILAARWATPRGFSVARHGDGGRGEDDISGSFDPWRAALTLGIPLTRDVHLDLRYEHSVTAFYESDHVGANLVGRF